MNTSWLKAGLGILLAGTLGCGDTSGEAGTQPQDVEVEFQALVGGETFDCSGNYTLGTAATDAQFTDLRLYISDVHLQRADGSEVSVDLTDDGMWQDGEVALLDFEDGSGACDNGNEALNTSITGTAPAGDYTGLRFSLGVPFEVNHQDAAVAGAPLNITSMFWNWQGGYKFLRIDGKAGEGAGFRVHLGSTACESPDGSNDVTGCGNQNRPLVELSGFDPSVDTVAFDAGALFSDVDMTPDQEGKSAICMSSPDHSVCEQIFPKLGLSFGDAPAQDVQVFSIAE